MKKKMLSLLLCMSLLFCMLAVGSSEFWAEENLFEYEKLEAPTEKVTLTDAQAHRVVGDFFNPPDGGYATQIGNVGNYALLFVDKGVVSVFDDKWREYYEEDASYEYDGYLLIHVKGSEAGKYHLMIANDKEAKYLFSCVQDGTVSMDDVYAAYDNEEFGFAIRIEKTDPAAASETAPSDKKFEAPAEKVTLTDEEALKLAGEYFTFAYGGYAMQIGNVGNYALLFVNKGVTITSDKKRPEYNEASYTSSVLDDYQVKRSKGVFHLMIANEKKARHLLACIQDGTVSMDDVYAAYDNEKYGNLIRIERQGATVTPTEKATEAPAEPTESVEREKQPLTVNVKTVSIKAKTLKKKAVKISSAVTVKKAKGTLTYAKIAKGSAKCLTISKKGVITVKKKTKNGTYKIKIKIYAKATKKYKAAKKTVTVKVKVR